MNIMRNYTKSTVTLEAFLEEHNLAILMRRGEDHPREYNAHVENHGVLDGARILHVNGCGATEHDSLVNLCNLLSGRRLTLCIHGGRGVVIQVPELLHILEPEPKPEPKPESEPEPEVCCPACKSSNLCETQTRWNTRNLRPTGLQIICDNCGLRGPFEIDMLEAREAFSRLRFEAVSK